MIATALVARLAFIALEAVALIARLALVPELASSRGCDSLFEFLDFESDFFALLHDVTSLPVNDSLL